MPVFDDFCTEMKSKEHRDTNLFIEFRPTFLEALFAFNSEFISTLAERSRNPHPRLECGKKAQKASRGTGKISCLKKNGFESRDPFFSSSFNYAFFPDFFMGGLGPYIFSLRSRESRISDSIPNGISRGDHNGVVSDEILIFFHP